MDKPLEKYELEATGIYRSLSKAAVAGAIFAVPGLLFLVATPMIVLPLAALALSLTGLSSVNRYPEEVSGRKLALFGIVLSAVVLVGGISWHGWVYATEVPEGYERISFRMLRDDSRTSLPYSEEAEALDGKKVFIKGYIRPGNRGTDLKDFMLVGDLGTCCFGGSPKITEVVAVSILGEERVSYGWRTRRIAGTFRLNRKEKSTGERDVPRVFYQIDADIVR